MSKDKFRLLSRLRKFHNLTADKKQEFLVKLQHDVEKSTQIYTTRLAQRPAIDFPSLPVCERKDEIAEAIANNQVVILAIGYWLLAIGYWLLAIVYCLLPIVYCLLSIVYWILKRTLSSSLVILLYGWTGQRSGSGFSDLAPSTLHCDWF